jgi:kinesin family protein 11
MRVANQRLTDQGTRPDKPTGATPRKKVWNYVDHWDLTENRQDLLRRKAGEKHSAPNGTATQSATMSSSLISQIENQGEESAGANSMQSSSISDQVRSPTSSNSSRSSSSQDSPVTQASSVELNTRSKITGPPQNTTKRRVSSAGGLHPVARPVPLVESRLKNMATRRSQRFVR